MKNSKVKAIFFAMIPGAGHMYLGLRRQGIQLMILFFLNMFLSANFNIEFLAIFLPVLWFYSIFDVRAKVMSEKPLVDSDLDIFSCLGYNQEFYRNRSTGKYIGWFLIIIGALELFNNFVFPMIEQYVGYSIIRGIKSISISLVFIVFGLMLLKRKKKVLYLKAGEEECNQEE